MESFMLKSSEFNNEFQHKARDWDAETQRGSEALRAIKEHE